MNLDELEELQNLLCDLGFADWDPIFEAIEMAMARHNVKKTRRGHISDICEDAIKILVETMRIKS